MLKVWGRASSNNVQKVTWCCDELGLPYERVDTGGNFGGTDTPGYRAMNPNGLVPTVSDDGLVLWESNAIVRYLSAKYGAGSLWPEDPAARALSDLWMDWQMGTFWPAFRTAFLGITRPGFGASPEEISAFVDRTADALAILDEHLSDKEYVAGAELTVGDVALGPGVYRWLNVEIERPSLPHLEAWHERLSERPAYRENVMVGFVLEEPGR
jgi:glutathione S-transferase